MEVTLRLYSFRFWLINLTHTEISYDGRDFGFGRQGVMVSPSQIDKTQFGFKLKRVIYAGLSNVQPEAFDMFVRNSVLRFNRHSYNLFTRNCRHFSEFLLIELTPNQPDEGKYFCSRFSSLIYFSALQILRKYRYITTTTGLVLNEVYIFIKNKIRNAFWLSVGLFAKYLLEKYQEIRGES